MVEIRIYFEGAPVLREGFQVFLRELRDHGIRLNLISARGGDQAIDDFRTALKKHPEVVSVLLIDSEVPFSDRLFNERCQKRGIPFQSARAVFWMVQCMEAWFLADPEALQGHFHRRLREGALAGNPNVEEIPKHDVLDRLKTAIEGGYHKTRHAPELLKRIRPERVRQASGHCRRLFEELPKLASTGRS